MRRHQKVEASLYDKSYNLVQRLTLEVPIPRLIKVPLEHAIAIEDLATDETDYLTYRLEAFNADFALYILASTTIS